MIGFRLLFPNKHEHTYLRAHQYDKQKLNHTFCVN